jgi:SAM-dependent methyltransferase
MVSNAAKANGLAVDGTSFDTFERAGWERVASAYHDFAGDITPRVVESLLDAARVTPGDRVLDVASGPGYAAARAAARGASAVGVDIAEAMIALARDRHPDVQFRHGDAQALPFPDGSFDAVVGNFALHHFGDPDRAAGEFARILIPGGRLALSVWDVPSRARLVGVLLDAVSHAGAAVPPDLPAGPEFFRFSHESELVSLLERHEFLDVTVRGVSFLHRIGSADELWDGLLGGTVRTAAVVRAQPAPVRRRIRAAFEALVEVHRTGQHLEVPVSVKLAAGVGPPARTQRRA